MWQPVLASSVYTHILQLFESSNKYEASRSRGLYINFAAIARTGTPFLAGTVWVFVCVCEAFKFLEQWNNSINSIGLIVCPPFLNSLVHTTIFGSLRALRSPKRKLHLPGLGRRYPVAIRQNKFATHTHTDAPTQVGQKLVSTTEGKLNTL